MTIEATEAKPSRAVRQVTPPAEGADRLLRRREVEELIGYSKNWIYRKIRNGDFPEPYRGGGASSRWSYREVADWMEQFKAG